ncbi:MAG: succinylglutamate desuccinylase/aspartoacylase family protein [Nanoarchaeota archaeon]|nr:succinylglutamate desuccinylase/aspartoacylase family protein [Nanoarchaeota archaeon]MBU4300269.1 succinylglutamate desuccinylase/aspartoacylase family protein [Nanoarchaeota archaeon]MBU4452518.1 succinylglutamate desuccinylase/aspartoacylase family protein [Nanoarchaeota archaeon]MCG2723222.1 succinylglutamate desuccinylase/aspartoacylase family protein [archaeon]
MTLINDRFLKIENPPFQDIKIKYSEVIGTAKGPSLFVISGIHGNELTGVELIRRLRQYLEKKSIYGKIVLLPVANPLAFYSRQRKTLYDGKDLNRCFPGDRSGSITEKIAFAITEEIIKTCDYGIDIHTGPEGRILMSHSKIMFDEEKEILELARAFGTLVAIPRKGTPTMLSVYATSQKIPSLGVELGEANKLDEAYIKTGFFGVINVARYLGILKGTVNVLNKQFIITNRLNIKPRISGIFFPKVALGSVVGKGTLLAEIHNLETDEKEEIRAEKRGIIMSVQTYSVALAGTTVVSILALDSVATNDVALKKKVTYYHSNDPEILWKEMVF